MKVPGGNPFVVLADVTIALCFIFAVYSVSQTMTNSQLLLGFDRTKRQEAAARDIRDAVANSVSGTGYALVRAQTRWQVEPVAYRRQNPGKLPRGADWIPRPVYEDWQLREKEGEFERLYAQVQANSSFLRISSYDVAFQPNSSKLTPAGVRLYSALAEAIKPHASQIDYLFVHGVTEPEEPTGSEAASLDLSVKRAHTVYSLLQAKKLVIPQPKGDKLMRGGVWSKYAIPYGTGTSLYHGVSTVGRVDLVLFFTDLSNADKDRSG